METEHSMIRVGEKSKEGEQSGIEVTEVGVRLHLTGNKQWNVATVLSVAVEMLAMMIRRGG